MLWFSDVFRRYREGALEKMDSGISADFYSHIKIWVFCKIFLYACFYLLLLFIDFTPLLPGARGFEISNPSVMSIMPLFASLEVRFA